MRVFSIISIFISILLLPFTGKDVNGFLWLGMIAPIWDELKLGYNKIITLPDQNGNLFELARLRLGQDFFIIPSLPNTSEDSEVKENIIKARILILIDFL